MPYHRRDLLRFGLTSSPTLLQFWLPLQAEAQCSLPLPPGSATAYALPAVSNQPRPSIAELAGNGAQLGQFREAVRRMRALTGTTPLRWESQARLHCATCGGGAASAEDIHRTWSFLPWHRAFLHFHERILGKLVNQPNLRIPYWDWESATSRTVPGMYSDAAPNSLLETRNPAAPLRDSEVSVGATLRSTDWRDLFGTAGLGGTAYGGPMPGYITGHGELCGIRNGRPGTRYFMLIMPILTGCGRVGSDWGAAVRIRRILRLRTNGSIFLMKMERGSL